MNLAERVFEEVRALPEFELREVLDFVGYLKSRHGLPAVAASNDAVVDWDGLQVHALGMTCWWPKRSWPSRSGQTPAFRSSSRSLSASA